MSPVSPIMETLNHRAMLQMPWRTHDAETRRRILAMDVITFHDDSVAVKTSNGWKVAMNNEKGLMGEAGKFVAEQVRD